MLAIETGRASNLGQRTSCGIYEALRRRHLAFNFCDEPLELVQEFWVIQIKVLFRRVAALVKEVSSATHF